MVASSNHVSWILCDWDDLSLDTPFGFTPRGSRDPLAGYAKYKTDKNDRSRLKAELVSGWGVRVA